jgi:hypothetical protein
MGEKKLDSKKKLHFKSKLLEYAKIANDALKKEADDKKNEVLNERLPILPNLTTMDEEQVRQLCRELHAQTDKTDDSRYDLEIRSKKLQKEIDDLNQKIADIKGKFKKPMLKRVRISADQMLKTLLGSKGKATQIDMRSQLKAKK